MGIVIGLTVITRLCGADAAPWKSAKWHERAEAAVSKSIKLADGTPGLRIENLSDRSIEYILASARAKDLDRIGYVLPHRVVFYGSETECFFHIRALGKSGRLILDSLAVATPEWKSGDLTVASGRCAVPPGTQTVELSVKARGPITIEMTQPQIVVLKPKEFERGGWRRHMAVLKNKYLRVLIDPGTLELEILDLRNRAVWKTHRGTVVWQPLTVEATDRQITIRVLHLPTNKVGRIEFALSAEDPTLRMTTHLPPETSLPFAMANVASVPAFRPVDDRDELVVPLGEGFLFRMSDRALAPQLLQFGQGYGMSMDFWGVTRGPEGPAVACTV
ncbi:MAG: hypothetical protein ABIZ18_06955, partial [Caldimonas sp.]